MTKNKRLVLFLSALLIAAVLLVGCVEEVSNNATVTPSPTPSLTTSPAPHQPCVSTPTPLPIPTSPAHYSPQPEPETIIAYPGGPNFTIPFDLTYPYNQSLKPLRYGIVPLPQRVEEAFPTGSNISIDTDISVQFSRWIPPEVVKLEITPYIEMSHARKEFVGMGSQKYTFYPTEPLQPNTDYNVTVTFGLNRTEPLQCGEEYCAPYETITWIFTTEPTPKGDE